MPPLTTSRDPGLAVSVRDASGVSGARRAATDFARQAGLGQVGMEKAALIVTEASTNLIKHAGGGEVLLTVLRWPWGNTTLQIIVLDKGRGMSNPAECLRDGYSTAGSPGTGLGAIKRLSDQFDIFSHPERGTVLWSELTAGTRRQQPHPTIVGAVSRPKVGEDICGDQWIVQDQPRRCRALLADGLGHGPGAAEAAFAAVRLFEGHPDDPLGALLQLIHAGLRSTRGAAVSVAQIDFDRSVVQYAGVGNISGVIASPQGTRSLVSLNGTAGLEVRKVTEFSYPWPPDAVMILHSDGLATHWKLEDYPGLLQRHPAVIAAVLYRDYTRGRDDVTVVVVKQGTRGSVV